MHRRIPRSGLPRAARLIWGSIFTRTNFGFTIPRNRSDQNVFQEQSFPGLIADLSLLVRGNSFPSLACVSDQAARFRFLERRQANWQIRMLTWMRFGGLR